MLWALRHWTNPFSMPEPALAPQRLKCGHAARQVQVGPRALGLGFYELGAAGAAFAAHADPADRGRRGCGPAAHLAHHFVNAVWQMHTKCDAFVLVHRHA